MKDKEIDSDSGIEWLTSPLQPNNSKVSFRALFELILVVGVVGRSHSFDSKVKKYNI